MKSTLTNLWKEDRKASIPTMAVYIALPLILGVSANSLVVFCLFAVLSCICIVLTITEIDMMGIQEENEN